jgi:hypothetical protein
VETAPVSSETYLSTMGLPENNSPAVSEGSIEGAGGKMSDWKESDWARGACVGQFGRERDDFVGDYERDRLDGARGELVRACDLALRGADHAAQDKAHPALWVARFVFIQACRLSLSYSKHRIIP